MGHKMSKNSDKERKIMILKDKRLIYKSKNYSTTVKLWLKYSKIENKTKEELEFIRYLECFTILST